MPQRVLGNVLIAAGALSPAMGGVLVANHLGDYLFISELLGAIIMFIGFRLATAQQPVTAPAMQSAST
jgi:ABC-type Mn2+/Zn2+ transport system permease subunit